MGFGKALFIIIRTCQGLFSLAALGCGAYIAYTLQSLSVDIDKVGTYIENYVANNTTATANEQKDVADGVKVVKDVFGGAPIRAYIFCGVSLWSLCVILYLLIAQHARNHSLNRRSIVIPIEIFTVIFWAGGFVCIMTLALEFEPVCYVFAWVDKFGKIADFLDEVPILGDMLKTCSFDKIGAVAAALCWGLWCITSLVACCVDRDGNCCGRRSKNKDVHSETGVHETFMPMQHVDGTPKSCFVVSGRPIENEPSYFNQGQETAYYGAPIDASKRKLLPQSPSPSAEWPTPAPQYHSPASQRYSPVPQYASPQPDYATTPTDRWGR